MTRKPWAFITAAIDWTLVLWERTWRSWVRQAGYLTLAWICSFKPMLIFTSLGSQGQRLSFHISCLHPISHFRSLLYSLAPEMKRSKESRMRKKAKCKNLPSALCCFWGKEARTLVIDGICFLFSPGCEESPAIIYFHCKTARGGKCAYNAAEARVPPTMLDFLFCSTASCSGQVRGPQWVQELWPAALAS